MVLINSSSSAGVVLTAPPPLGLRAACATSVGVDWWQRRWKKEVGDGKEAWHIKGQDIMEGSGGDAGEIFKRDVKEERERDCHVPPPAVLLILGCHANKSAFELSRIQREREMRRVEGGFKHDPPSAPSSVSV